MFKKMEKKQVLTLLSVSEHHLVCHLLSSAAIAFIKRNGLKTANTEGIGGIDSILC